MVWMVPVGAWFVLSINMVKAYKVRTRFTCKFILSAHQHFLVKIDKNQFTFLCGHEQDARASRSG
jgi:hypothetical protein